LRKTDHSRISGTVDDREGRRTVAEPFGHVDAESSRLSRVRAPETDADVDVCNGAARHAARGADDISERRSSRAERPHFPPTLEPSEPLPRSRPRRSVRKRAVSEGFRARTTAPIVTHGWTRRANASIRPAGARASVCTVFGPDPVCYLHPRVDSRFDVVITGGGLAGLTLARQLHLEAPHLRVLVCEKRRHPVPEAAFKVGESSVEIGAHYFKTIVNLAALLERDHLPKLGLRYFFPHEDNRDLATRVELGTSVFPPVPSFQLDRGRLENSLLTLARESGASVLDGCRVSEIIVFDPEH
jgi:hypothetical protein